MPQKIISKKQILHVSLLKDDIKNVSGIIKAIKDLSMKRRDFELHIVGNGVDREKLEILSEKYGLLNRIDLFRGNGAGGRGGKFLLRMRLLRCSIATFETFFRCNC